MMPQNIFAETPPEHSDNELFEGIVVAERVKIERIVSNGHCSPQGFWYDQDQDEWVMVLEGCAGLVFEGNDEIIKLEPGDWINIPAHKKHRVEWTEPGERTIWLAVHYDSR